MVFILFKTEIILSLTRVCYKYFKFCLFSVFWLHKVFFLKVQKKTLNQQRRLLRKCILIDIKQKIENMNCTLILLAQQVVYFRLIKNLLIQTLIYFSLKDTDNMKIVFAMVKDTILQIQINQCGLVNKIVLRLFIKII